ncbi:alpha/beta hydrolase [Nocardia sp. NBC_01377]
MSSTAPKSSHHLLDPEIAPVLAAFPPFQLSSRTLQAIRDQMRARPTPDGDALFPAVARTERHVPGFDGAPEVRVLHYEPRERTAEVPALIWHHGGGYVIGSAEDDDLLCRQIATETSAIVVSVDYRLAPECPAPGPLHDGYAVLRWVAGNAGDLGVDPARIAVGGQSAGGGLAAALAILARDKGEIPVSFQLLIYPMLDDRTATTAAPHARTGDFVWHASDNIYGWTSYLGHDPGGDDVSPYAAPARVPDITGLPPAFICVGALDLFVGEDITYAKRLLEQGIPTELHVHPGGPHGYNMVPGSRLATTHVRDLIGAIGRHFADIRTPAPVR